jgi:cadmium resistance protein CadD (predicted permease)
MRLITKIVAGTLLVIGIPVTLLASLEVADLKAPPQNREESLAALVFLGLVPTILGGGLIWNGMRHDRKQERDRLRKIFYEQLKEHNGEITTIQFAMASGLTGADSKVFLDEMAQEFNAGYDVLEEGSISYRFRISGGE